jgi:hypothetical protein
MKDKAGPQFYPLLGLFLSHVRKPWHHIAIGLIDSEGPLSSEKDVPTQMGNAL